MTIDRIVETIRENKGGTFDVRLASDFSISIKPVHHDTGYYVGIKNTSSEYDIVTDRILLGFIMSNYNKLSDSYLGVWYDNNKYILEASKYYPDIVTARAMMKINNQKCIYSISDNESIDFVESMGIKDGR